MQICPVGALTGAQYRFRARPFDLVSTPSVCEHCSAGCAQRTDQRRGKVLRRLAGDDPAVNEEWNCDKGRWGFQYATATDRLTTPAGARRADRRAARGVAGPRRCAVAAEGLRRGPGRRDGVGGADRRPADRRGRVRVREVRPGRAGHQRHRLPGPPARRARGGRVPGRTVAGVTDVTYADVEQAPAVVLVGLEPEEECPILFLRLRKAYRKNGLTGLRAWRRSPPAAWRSSARPSPDGAGRGGQRARRARRGCARRCATQGAILIVGERLATVPGGLSAAADAGRGDRREAGLGAAARR